MAYPHIMFALALNKDSIESGFKNSASFGANMFLGGPNLSVNTPAVFAPESLTRI